MKQFLLFVLAFVLLFPAQAQDVKSKRDKETKLYGYVIGRGKAEQWVVQPQFTKVDKFDKGFARVYVNSQVGLVNTKGQVIVPAKYTEVKFYHDSFIKMKDGSVEGITDYSGKVLIQPIYSNIEITGNLALVTKNNLSGLIDINNGQTVFELQFSKASFWGRDHLLFQKDNLWGIIALESRSIIYEPEFSSSPIISGDYVFATKGNLWGVNKLEKKEVVFEPQFSDVRTSPIKGKIYIKKNDVWGLADAAAGIILCEPQFDEMVGVVAGEKYFLVANHQKATTEFVIKATGSDIIRIYGLLSLKGETLLETTYLRLHSDPDTGWFFTQKIEGKQVSKSIVFDNNLNVLASIGVGEYSFLPYDYKPERYFNDYGLCIVNKMDIKEGKVTRKYGLVDKNFKLVMPLVIDDHKYTFKNGFLSVRVGEKWTYINKTGAFVTEPQFTQSADFEEVKGKGLCAKVRKFNDDNLYYLFPDGRLELIPTY